MTLVQRFSTAWGILRRRARLLLLATVLPHLVGLGLIFAMRYVLMGDAAPGETPDPRELWHGLSVSGKMTVFLIWLLNTSVAFAVGQAGVTYVLAGERENQSRGPGAMFSQMARSSLVLVPAFLVLGVPWMIAHMFVVIPGFVVATLVCFVPAAVVLERAGPFRALKISASLAGRIFGPVFTLWAMIGSLTLVALVLLFLLISNVPQSSYNYVILDSAGVAIFAFVEAILGCMLTGYYLDARSAGEIAAATGA